PCQRDPDDIGTVTIYIKAPEPPPAPVANDDTYRTAENTTLEIAPPGVLANDFVHPSELLTAINHNEPNRPPLTVVLVAAPQHGTVALNADGSFKSVPTANFTGDDTFTYQAQLVTPTDDGANTTHDTPPILSNIAKVTIHVLPAIAHNDN